MKKLLTTIALLVFACLVPSGSISAELELPSTAIFSRGPNEYAGDILEITKGRGATIAWYIQATKTEEVRVSIEYSCVAPLNQAYQLSFDGDDRFWNVIPTEGNEFSRAELGIFQIRAGLPILVMLVPPSGTKYPHPLRFRKLIIESATPGNLTRVQAMDTPVAPEASPGFGSKLLDLHPALSALDLRDEALTLRISGMKMRSENSFPSVGITFQNRSSPSKDN